MADTGVIGSSSSTSVEGPWIDRRPVVTGEHQADSSFGRSRLPIAGAGQGGDDVAQWRYTRQPGRGGIDPAGVGSWSSNSKTCAQTVYSGTVYSCNHSYSISGYVGNGFYGKSNVQWWNQYSPNPSNADGSWTLTESHGPMDCVNGRSQIGQFR